MKNKAALVTGAASGLGLAVAKKLARAGANVCLVDIDSEGLVQAAAEIHQYDVQSMTQTVDLSLPGNCKAAVEAATGEFGRLDALCNIAAVMMSLEEADPGLLGRSSPLRGLVEIDDVADTVAFLSSDAAHGYHGSCIVIDNGMCAG